MGCLAGQLALLDLPEVLPAITRREDLDFWPTPHWLAVAGLRSLHCNLGPRILDVGAGEGALGIAAEQVAVERGQPRPQITAVELHPGRAAVLRAAHPTWEVLEVEFFAWAQQQAQLAVQPRRSRQPSRHWDLVVSNPPQAIEGRHVWVDWVSRLYNLADPTLGRMMALGHDLLLTTAARAAWWRAHPADWYRPSPRRPSFSGDGRTDGRVWAWWTWLRGPMPIVIETRMELLEVEWP